MKSIGKFIYVLSLIACLTTFANAQFGDKLKKIGNQIKKEAKPTATPQTSVPNQTRPSQASTDRVTTSTPSKATGKVVEYFEMTVGGKTVLADPQCFYISGELRNNSLEIDGSGMNCPVKTKIPFKLQMAVNGVDGRGTYYVPRKDSEYAGSLSVTPAGTLNDAYSTNAEKKATVTVVLTKVTEEYVEGTLTGTLLYDDNKTKAPVTGKFKIEINENFRSEPSWQQSELDKKNSEKRGGGANEKGEYLSLASDDSAIPFDSNCAFYSSYIESGDLVARVNESQCPSVTNRQAQSFDIIIRKYKGKGVYKVSAARALRSGDMSITVGKTANNEQYMTEVDLGGLATITITNATAEYAEGTFTANLVNPMTKKKQNFSGSFRINIGER